MKKLAIVLVALLLITTFGASATYVVKPDTINSIFTNDSDTNWTMSWNRGDNGALTIEDTANVDGFTYRVSFEGTENSVYRVTMIGWFSDMEMLDGGMFSEGLFVYNDLMHACTSFLPYDHSIYEVFNSYDIYPSVKAGSRYYDGETFEGWELLPTQPGRLLMRGDSGTVEAERLEDGRFWFAINF